jgi:hypothetical protein
MRALLCMKSSICRHLSYANVVATMALVCAMGGSALAANHFVASADRSESREFSPEAKSKEFRYLITSGSQISPKVMKALETRIARKLKPGAPGIAGAIGKEGPVGKEGIAGPTGAQGVPGTEGQPGLAALSREEQEKLKTILPYIKLVARGVGGKPTIEFSGANVQIVNGEGSTQTANGAGNLIIGYDESPGQQTGSHDVIVGPEDGYTSYGSIIGGRDNKALAPYDFVAGIANKTSDEGASVSGGKENTAEASFSSIFGGKELTTKTEYEAIP